MLRPRTSLLFVDLSSPPFPFDVAARGSPWPPLAACVCMTPVWTENRMHAMMAETLPYLQKRAREDSSFTYEIIIVDDGSRDATDHIALEYVSRYGTDAIRLLKLVKNQGKGGAVQQGMLHARGELLLMVDADGATEISELGKLEKAVKECMTKDGHGLAVGSRAHLEDAAIAERKWYRNILMHGFHFLVSCLCVRGIRDTQCGFKLFARNTARLLFANQHVRRWCFDVELLHIAQRKGVPMREVGVRWQEIPGSKLALLESSVLMGRDLVVIRFCYMFGFWKVQDVKTLQKQA